jgi:MFS family permease
MNHPEEASIAKLKYSFINLIIARFITRSGDVAWMYIAIPMMLAELFPKSVFEVSTLLICTNASVVLFMPSLGGRIDVTDRLRIVRLFAVMQLIGTIGTGLTPLLYFYTASLSPWIALIWLDIFGILLTVGFYACNVAIQNDWIPELAEKDQTLLPWINARLQQSNLLSQTLIPFAASAVMMIGSIHAFFTSGFFILLIFNVYTFIIEYVLLRSVYNAHNVLKGKHHKKVEQIAGTFSDIFKSFKVGFVKARKLFIFPIIVSQAFLWVTFLSPHSFPLITFFITEWNFSNFSVGAFKGIAAILGIIPSFLFPFLLKRYSIKMLYPSFLLFQSLCLLIVVVTIKTESIMVQIGVMTLLICSRFGLHGADLINTQLKQQYIPAQDRGKVGAFSTTLDQFGLMLTGFFGLMFSSTSQFYILALISFGAVFIATVITAVWCRYAQLE